MYNIILDYLQPIKHVFGGQIYVVQGGRSWQLFGDCRKSHKAFEDRAFSKFHDKNAGLVYFGVVTFSSTQYQKIHREVVKNGLFTVRLTSRGGEVSPPRP